VSRTAQDPLDLYIPESGYGITEEGRIAISKELNLDRSVPVAYVLWLGKAVRGDLGKSLKNKPQYAPTWSRLMGVSDFDRRTYGNFVGC
jgi:ABC-type dipeptide/oligopeptide/nickel transport system permease component